MPFLAGSNRQQANTRSATQQKEVVYWHGPLEIKILEMSLSNVPSGAEKAAPSGLNTYFA